jgi:hypothetical protein
MARELSPRTEQYLDSIVSAGLFPSKEAALEAALEAAVETLRERFQLVPAIPADGTHRAGDLLCSGRTVSRID